MAGKKNFLVVDSKVHIKEPWKRLKQAHRPFSRQDVEEHFHELTSRKDISMILITQDCAEMIRRAVDEFGHSGQMIPTVLEIPSKDTPYDPRKDGVMQRVAFFMPSVGGLERWAPFGSYHGDLQSLAGGLQAFPRGFESMIRV